MSQYRKGEAFKTPQEMFNYFRDTFNKFIYFNDSPILSDNVCKRMSAQDIYEKYDSYAPAIEIVNTAKKLTVEDIQKACESEGIGKHSTSYLIRKLFN